MSRPVPAATSAARLLKHLAKFSTPVPAMRLSDDLDIPRSSLYPLLDALRAEEFLAYYPEDHGWGIGIGAWELGFGFARQESLTRLAMRPLSQLVLGVSQWAHLAILNGPDVLYLITEGPAGTSHLVTDVGVRLPAHLTASGRSILAQLPARNVDALYPSMSSFSTRTGLGPRTPAELRRLLAETRNRGYAFEEHEISDGFSSIAAPVGVASLHASVAVTWPARDHPDPLFLLDAVRKTADQISRRLASGRR